jgi:alpha 1,3-glucosidase
LDAIWLDIEYTEGRSKKYFTWDPVTFSDHKTLISNLTTKGRRLIAIIDPHMKKDSGYPTYNEAVENNYLIKNKDGGDYEGWCWPGASMWPDYLNPQVRKWWADKFKPEFFPGFPGGVVDIWNDMNEPSVFNGPEITAPRDLKHHDGWEHRDLHNIYGMLMLKATHAGLVEHRPNLRPYILTRSFFVGSQRYASAWTGDNMGKWEHLKESIPMLLSLSIVGMTFSGADVPGFFFNPESNEMVARWYQAGAFQPFFRAHAHLDTKRREPWTFDEQTKLLIRDAIRTRYSYLPYMYTLFRENSLNGSPIMRPLWFHFPADSKTFSIDHSYLLGSALLIQPVVTKGATSAEVYFPGDNSVQWYDLDTNTVYGGGSTHTVAAPLSKIPIFQRSGTIVPRRERVRRSAALTLEDPLSLDIVVDTDGSSAHGELYFDDGATFNYQNDDYIAAEIKLNDGTLTYRIVSGKRQSKVWLERISVYGIASKPSKVSIVGGGNSESLQFKYDAEAKLLVVRKPGLNMAHNWQITIN